MCAAPPLLWDVFCRVVDNHGDLGVCWRLACQLAQRGQRVRLWVDDTGALAWMAPQALLGGVAGVQVVPWRRAQDAEALKGLVGADVWIEAFGCELPAPFVAAGVVAVRAHNRPPPVWINLEYLSAEPWVERMHGLPSPVVHGPAAGWQKWFFYPGFTTATGGLLRAPDLLARQAAFDRAGWLAARGVGWRGERLVSMFCYEPPALASYLAQLQASAQPTLLLVTAGRAQRAVAAALGGVVVTEGDSMVLGALRVCFLPHVAQPDYDALLWACELNFVRGEDSLTRALWADRPLVWQPYPQADGADSGKLQAFLDWLDAPDDCRRFHRRWAGHERGGLPPVDEVAWRSCVQRARQRLLEQPDLVASLLRFMVKTR